MTDPTTMTACENLCRDFVWLGPFTEWLRNAALVVGVGVGWYQLGAWRREKRQVRRSEIAEDAIASAFSVLDALKSIRNPLSSIPQEEQDNKQYPYAKRYERIVEANDLFAQLRQSQIRVRAVIGDAKVDEAIQTLFEARAEISVAILTLADYADAAPASKFEQEYLTESRRTMSGIGGDGDELGQKIEKTVGTIEARLSPVARLEQKK